MVSQIKLGDIAVEVVQKDIKNVHLSVHPPTGRVRISAPIRMRIDTIRVFAISKLDWIRKQQRKVREQEREAPREYLDRESHYVWGKRYLLSVREGAASPTVRIRDNRLILSVRRGSVPKELADALSAWYRDLVWNSALESIAKWQPIMGVRVRQLFVQHMKTRWGTCNPRTGTIRLNTELAKKPRECLEYVVIHEMVHLLERTHGDRFVALMDGFLPQWKAARQKLNQIPVRHEDWKY